MKRTCKRQTKWPDWLLVILLATIVWAFFYWPLISGTGIPGFRDSSHFYLPLYSWIAEQIDSGQLPLWNSNENLGVDVVGDGSSAIFYPLKCLMHLPIGDYSSRFGWYIAIHGFLVIMNSMIAAKRLGCRPIPAAVVGLSFGLSGPVLFASTNVIFLVSLCWLPLAISEIWMTYRKPTFAAAFRLTIYLSLMNLGGDPQMAYHCVILAVLCSMHSCLIAIRYLWQKSYRNPIRRAIIVRHWRFQLRVIGSVVMTLGLCAVQTVPSYMAAKQSDRSFYSIPNNIYQIPEYLQRSDKPVAGVMEGIVGEPQRESHTDERYQFSQTPWSLIETLWPNISGKPYPTHQRWTDLHVSADRVWTPSLYFGLALLISSFCIRSRKANGKLRWLYRSAFFFCIGSFGWYGIGWLIKEATIPVIGANPTNWLGSQVGGIYWMLETFAPFYSGFRYPAKLFPVALICFCLAGGLKLNSIRPAQIQQTRIIAILIVHICSIVTLLILVFLDWRPGSDADSVTLFGPFDSSVFYSTLIRGVGQTSVVLCFTLVLFRQGKKRKLGAAKLHAWILIICVIDLAAANNWLIPINESDNASSLEEVQSILESEGQTHSKSRVYRCHATIWRPNHWFNHREEDRLCKVQLWEFKSCFARTALLNEIECQGAFTSISPIDDRMIGISLRRLGSELSVDHGVPLEWLEHLGFQYIICESAPLPQKFSSRIQRIYHGDEFQVLKVLQTGNRVSVRRSATPIARHETFVVGQRFNSIDESILAWWEECFPPFELNQQKRNLESNHSKSPGKAKIVDCSLSGAQVQATMNEKGWLIFAYRYSPYLKARLRRIDESDWQTVEVEQVDGILSGVALDAGEYEIEFQYVHDSFWIGFTVSVVSVFLLVAIVVVGRLASIRLAFQNKKS